MSIGTELLSLRRDQASSVATLLALLDWERQAQDPDHKTSRHYAALECADVVLMNVAVHAAEAENDFGISGTRRTITPERSRRRFPRRWWSQRALAHKFTGLSS